MIAGGERSEHARHATARAEMGWKGNEPVPGMKSVDVLAELVRGILAVGGCAALEQLGGLQRVLLGAGGLQCVDGDQVAELGRALKAQAPGHAGQETGPERVAGPSRL